MLRRRPDDRRAQPGIPSLEDRSRVLIWVVVLLMSPTMIGSTRVVGTVACLMALASCGGGDDVDGVAHGSGAPVQGGRAAPSVSEPLEVGRFEQQPCQLLSADQLATLDGDSGTPETSVGVPTCRWVVRGDARVVVNIRFESGAGKGLGSMYQQNEGGVWKNGYFQPTEIDGYPAAFASLTDGRADGFCDLAVGVREDRYFYVNVGAFELGRQSCAIAEEVAAAAVATLRAG